MRVSKCHFILILCEKSCSYPMECVNKQTIFGARNVYFLEEQLFSHQTHETQSFRIKYFFLQFFSKKLYLSSYLPDLEKKLANLDTHFLYIFKIAIMHFDKNIFGGIFVKGIFEIIMPRQNVGLGLQQGACSQSQQQKNVFHGVTTYLPQKV